MQLKWLKKVYSDGTHNTFTGLALFQGRYFLAFRNGEKHGTAGGRQILMTSPDGENWELQRQTAFPCFADLPPGTPMDARDNYFLNLGYELRLHSFSLTPFLPAEDRYMGPSTSTVQATRDGETWTEPRAIFEGAILWKPIFWRNRFWCAGYRRATEAEGGRVVELYQSADGFDWTRGNPIAAGNECALIPRGGDVLLAFVRTGEKPLHMQLWESRAPFDSWRQIAVIPKIIQAPHLERLGDELYLFGREVPPTGADGVKPPSAARRTKIWRMRGTEAEEVLELPSRGDTSYVGTVVRPDGLLLVSYYGQHEAHDPDPAHDDPNNKPADVFVAGIEW